MGVRVEFGLLGTVAIWQDGSELAIGSAQRRCVLALLLLEPGRLVSAERLRDALWDETRAPDSARNVLQGCISHLRRLLAHDPALRLVHKHPGYVLAAPADRVDLYRFRTLVARAGETDDDKEIVGLLDRALTLWRGDPLADLDDSAVTTAIRSTLAEERLTAVESRLEARLRLGEHREVIGELTALVGAHPLRERLRCLHMLALYRSGHRAESLQSFQDARATLVAQLGVEPGPDLRQLHQRVLAADPAVLAPEEDRTPAPTPRQLPAAIPFLAGREPELATLHAALARHRARASPTVLTIDGTAGVGKSTVAIHFGHQVADRYPDGQLYLDLSGHATTPPLTADEALDQLLRGLGLPPGRIPAGTREKAATYRSMLAGKRVLVVLDNAHDATQIGQLLPGGPDCLVLVTSRHTLASVGGTGHVPLDVLSPRESQELLAWWIGPARVAAEPEATELLARLCACLPLALRVAGARLATRPSWRIGSMVVRLGNVRYRLNELSIDEYSVTDSFAASHRVLAVSEDVVDQLAARMFLLLGTTDREELAVPEAAELLRLPIKHALAALERLVDHHLLWAAAHSRYRTHELLRLHAGDLAAEAFPELRSGSACSGRDHR